LLRQPFIGNYGLKYRKRILNFFKAGGVMNSIDYISLILLAVLITIIVAIIVKLNQNLTIRKKRNERYHKFHTLKNATH